jgi:hypothetical protein
MLFAGIQLDRPDEQASNDEQDNLFGIKKSESRSVKECLLAFGCCCQTIEWCRAGHGKR